MSKLFLTLACREYDRTCALMDRTVQPEGIDLNYINLEVTEAFWRTLRHGEFDASEISTSGYLTTLELQPQPFVAIPVFPSRTFRHGATFINTRAGISKPQDLVGKRVGVPDYSMTAAVWVRGILQHEYGVSPDKLHWFQGNQTKPTTEERKDFIPTPNVRMESLALGKYLNDMIETGEIDAIISPIVPAGVRQGSPNVARLFPDFKKVEMDYYRRTGIFPIMHTVVIRREVYDKQPWIARSLYDAFCKSKDVCVARLYEADGHYTLPWWLAELEAEAELFGGELWPYGIEANRACLEALTEYVFEQGLTHRRFSVEELFAAETLAGVPQHYQTARAADPGCRVTSGRHHERRSP